MGTLSRILFIKFRIIKFGVFAFSGIYKIVKQLILSFDHAILEERKIMSIIIDTVKIPAHDGGAFAAYVARPDTEDDVPGIVVIQEIFGINADMRAKCDELAAQGYLAVCPDLFWRIEEGVDLVDSDPKQLERAFELFGLFNDCLLYTSPSPRDRQKSRMPSSA